MSKILESTLLAEEVTSYFEDVIGGIYSDEAWYELLVVCEKYKIGTLPEKKFLEYVEFIFGFEGQKDLDIVLRKSDRRYRKLIKVLE